MTDVAVRVDTPAKAWLRALQTSDRLTSLEEPTLAAVVETVAARTPRAPALLSDATSLTYDELAARIRRYTRWARAQALPAGSVVALLAPNAPDYVAAWLGLGRAGVAVALLDIRLAAAALAHGVDAARARILIADVSLDAVARAACEACVAKPALWTLGGGGGGDLTAALDACCDLALSAEEAPSPAAEDRALLIYTSGTTGLPKAANVSHRRVLSWSGWFAGLMDARPQDRLYDCLPMHHSVGGVVAIGAMLAAGGAVVIRERFSASRFWPDVVRWRCTLFQYIGELCRHLVNAPACDDERRHGLRLACGAGLSGPVWRAFEARFGGVRILEFYASTEGSFSLFNVEGEPGALGRIPAFLAHRFPVALVRHDAASGEPARGGDGLCLACGTDEPGEALGRVVAARGGGVGRFEGYTDAAATRAKIVRDVLEPGDAWFRSGDLMRQDARGFYYFVDRLGDTFRWKGENVSTTEVQNVLCSVAGVVDAAVYGVEVVGREGRAGMAALVTTPDFHLDRFHAAVAAALPAYARPIFLRLMPRLDRTATFRPIKTALVETGFDPARIDEPLVFDDPTLQRYRPLDRASYDAIVAGEIRI